MHVGAKLGTGLVSAALAGSALGVTGAGAAAADPNPKPAQPAQQKPAQPAQQKPAQEKPGKPAQHKPGRPAQQKPMEQAQGQQKPMEQAQGQQMPAPQMPAPQTPGQQMPGQQPAEQQDPAAQGAMPGEPPADMPGEALGEAGGIDVGADGAAKALGRPEEKAAQAGKAAPRWCNGKVAVQWLRVRKGPNGHSPHVRWLKRGTAVTTDWNAISRRGGYTWVRIKGGNYLADYKNGNGNGKWYVKYSNC